MADDFVVFSPQVAQASRVGLGKNAVSPYHGHQLARGLQGRINVLSGARDRGLVLVSGQV
jgi:hypothetical protein